jgi:hypothetical protein
MPTALILTLDALKKERKILKFVSSAVHLREDRTAAGRSAAVPST